MYYSKLWLLLPPDAHLTPTRVPYEESSVYCTENFFSPDAAATAQFDKIEAETYCVVLHAGDVLIVPHKWWHYAENQTLSLSINSWIPLVRRLFKFPMYYSIIHITTIICIIRYGLNYEQV